MTVLFSILALVFSVIAVSRSNDLSLKLAQLEKKINADNKIPQGKNFSISENVTYSKEEGNLSSDIEVSQFVENNETSSVQPVKEEQVSIQHKESAFITWLKEDWLLKLGGILVLMGSLFFLSIGFVAMGPQGKVIMGYIFGVSLMVFGFNYAKKQLVGGSTIHLIGAIVIIITTYLARQPSYNLFDPYFATLLMFLTTVCVALTAYAHNRKELAHAGLFLAAIVPLLTNTEGNSFSQLLIYLGVVTLGVLWLALVTGWRTLVLLALSIVCGYSLMKLGSLGGGKLPFVESYLLLVFGVLFYMTSLFSILRSRGITQSADGAVAVLNAGFALLWVTSQVPSGLAPIIIAIIGLTYAVGFFFVYKITNVYTSFFVYGGVALGLLTTAIMLQLSGRLETVALLLIGSGVTLLTYYLSGDEKITKTVAVFNVLPLFYVLKSITMISWMIYGGQSSNEAWKDIMILVTAVIIYFGLYAYFVSRIKELWQISLFISFSLSVIAVWQVLHLLIIGGFATFMSVLVYTVFGLTVLFQGVQEKNDTKIKIAKIWLGLVAARVIFWDAWQVGSTTLGVLICIVIGILLLSSTFILRKVTKE